MITEDRNLTLAEEHLRQKLENRTWLWTLAAFGVGFAFFGLWWLTMQLPIAIWLQKVIVVALMLCAIFLYLRFWGKFQDAQDEADPDNEYDL